MELLAGRYYYHQRKHNSSAVEGMKDAVDGPQPHSKLATVGHSMEPVHRSQQRGRVDEPNAALTSVGRSRKETLRCAALQGREGSL